MAGRRFSAQQAIELVTDDSLFDPEIGFCDEEESEDEFAAISDYTDASGAEMLMPDDLLCPSSMTLLSQVNNNPEPALRDSLLIYDSECDDGKYDENISGTV